jgi:glutaredoxin
MIKIYWKPGCKYCELAKSFLFERKLDYKLIQLGEDISIEYFKLLNPGIKTVPAIFIDEIFIGGYKDLVKEYENDKERFTTATKKTNL